MAVPAVGGSDRVVWPKRGCHTDTGGFLPIAQMNKAGDFAFCEQPAAMLLCLSDGAHALIHIKQKRLVARHVARGFRDRFAQTLAPQPRMHVLRQPFDYNLTLQGMPGNSTTRKDRFVRLDALAIPSCFLALVAPACAC